MDRKKKKKISVLEAVDNLSHLAELDTEKTAPEWLEGKEERIKETFETLNQYLRHLYQKQRPELNDPQTQRGIQAMMQLASEAVHKMEDLSSLFQGIVTAEGTIPEYQQLHQFYLSKIVSQLKKKGKEKWEETIEAASSSEVGEQRQALKDLEAVRLDHEYELFSIQNEDGSPFFNPNLLRHVRLVGNFDESVSSQEGDLLTQIDEILDKDVYFSAHAMLEDLKTLLDDYFQQALRLKENPCMAALTKACMALMLAANPRNLRQEKESKKSTIHYFIDFQTYLRQAIQTSEYQKWAEGPITDLEGVYLHAFKLIQRMCRLLFLRETAHTEILDWIHKLLGEKEQNPSFWVQLALADQEIRAHLSQLPSGPLLKTLELLRHHHEQSGYDPLLQKNPPSQLFSIATESFYTAVLHLPSPTYQVYIDQVQIVPEFVSYLDGLKEGKHLFVNLQDATSWKEHARCQKLEDFSKQGKVHSSLFLTTLAKNTDFYHQINEYAFIEDSQEFLRQFQEQLKGGAQCGFSFPKNQAQFDDLLQFVHREFFSHKEKLNRKERLDFIEVFYFFYTLQLISQYRCDSMSFSCKDGIDTGAAEAAIFFGMMRMLSSSSPWKEEEKDFFLYALYAPALLVRHRAIDPHRFKRALSALEYADEIFKVKRDSILKGCATLLPDLPLEKIKITEVA